MAVKGYEKTIEAAREEVQKHLQNGVSGASIAIRVDGKLVYSESFGLRDLANALPVDKDTQFNVGSVSKLFATASILILVQEW